MLRAKHGPLIDEGVERVRWFLGEYSPEYLWVPVSGGKDSAAVWGLVARATSEYIAVFIQIPGQTHRDNIESVYMQARILNVRDHVLVKVSKTRLIRGTLEEAVSTCSRPCLLHILAFDTHGRDYWAAMRQYGFPAPLGRFGKGTRWCCGTFKHRVLERLPYNGRRDGKPWKYGADGVKAADSPYRRKRYTSMVQSWERTRDTYLFPLLTATDKEVWGLLRELGLFEAVVKQYERWGRSPNCMWCPMLGKKAVERTYEAMPQAMKKLVARELEALRPRYKPTTFSYKAISWWLGVLRGDGPD